MTNEEIIADFTADPGTGRRRGRTDHDKREFFRASAAVATIDACQIWPWYIDQDGYGRVKLDGKDHKVHRLALELHLGYRLPPGMVAAHYLMDFDPPECSTLCFNWRHLSVETNAANVMAGRGVCALNARKTHCGTCGQPFSPENTTVTTSGRRRCRACHRASDHRFRARQFDRLHVGWLR